MTKRVIYLAGPYRAETEAEIEANIERARDVAKLLWRAGFVVICPHANTAHFERDCPYVDFVTGDLEIVARCHYVVMLDGWEKSKGACRERAFAKASGIEVFDSLDEFKANIDAPGASRIEGEGGCNSRSLTEG